MVRVTNDRLTKKMNQTVQTIIGRCESENGVRVVKMESEFLVDANDQLWFVRTRNVETTESDKQPSKMSNEASHNLRTRRAPNIERDMENEGLKARKASSAVIKDLKDIEHGGLAGSRTGNRLIRREMKEKGPDEELVDLIMNEDSASEAIRKKTENVAAKEELNRKQSVMLNKNSSMNNLVANLATGGQEDNVNDESSVTSNRKKKKKKKKSQQDSGQLRTQREIQMIAHSSSAAQALGSTQLSGCPGDFCDTVLSIDKSLDGVGLASHSHLSDFRRKLLEAETEDLGMTGGKKNNNKRAGHATTSQHPSKKMKGEDGEGEVTFEVTLHIIYIPSPRPPNP